MKLVKIEQAHHRPRFLPHPAKKVRRTLIH